MNTFVLFFATITLTLFLSSLAVQDGIRVMSDLVHNHANANNTLNIVILMSDNRDITVSKKLSKEFHENNEKFVNQLSGIQLTAGINNKYARKFNYEFRFYKTQCSENSDLAKEHNTCFPVNYKGKEFARSAGYARLLAVNHTLWEYREQKKDVVVLYLDSDSFISNFDIYFVSTKGVHFASWEDEGNPYRPCSGTFLVDNSEKGMEIINNWWYSYDHVDSIYNTKHPWDQQSLKQYICHKHKYDVFLLPTGGWRHGYPFHKVDTTTPYPGQTGWENGFFIDEYTKSAIGIREDKSPHKSQAFFSPFSNPHYQSFIRHMWGGLIDMKRYFLLDVSQRHHYPIIPESKLIPCSSDSTLKAQYPFLTCYTIKN